MQARIASFLLSFVLCLNSALATPLDDAIALYKEKKFTEARAELEKITTAEPQNAEACHYLGLALRRSRDPALLESSVDWLKKAVDLKPDNTTYLVEYGSTSLLLADKKFSLSAANHGRAALEKAVELDPANLDAREGLFLFHEQAPWPIGDSAKAAAQLEAIRERDPALAITLDISCKIKAKDYDDAFRLCDEALVQNPENYIVLLQYSRIALSSGQHLDQALTGLRKGLNLTPPPKAPGPAFVHCRIGNLLEKQGDPAAARAAYEAALQADPHFAKAREALENLK